ncbi:MAG: HAD family phosphatase, partial [archaeon]
MIKAIIFDMDGVLISSMQYHVASWKQAFEKFNIPTEEKDLFYLLEGLSYKETINFLAKKNNIDISEEDKLEIYKVKKEVLEHKFQINIYDGVMEILNYLKEKGLALAVVSGAHGEFVRNITSTFFKDFF